MSEVIQAILKAQMAAGDEEMKGEKGRNCLKAHLSAFGGWDGFHGRYISGHTAGHSLPYE